MECVTKITVLPLIAQIRSSSLFSRSRVISSSAPKGSSISSSAGEKLSARAIDTRCCIPPESCHGWCPSNPWSSTSASSSSTRCWRFALVPPAKLEGKRDVLRDRPPVVQDGVLEDDPVVAVAASPTRALPVDDDLARRGVDQVADDAQERRLPAAGRPDEGDELAGEDVEIDRLQRRDATRAEGLRHVAERDDGLGAHPTCSGARRTTSRSARRTDEEERDPEQRGDQVRRPEPRGGGDVVLVEVQDRASEPVLDRGRAAHR